MARAQAAASWRRWPTNVSLRTNRYRRSECNARPSTSAPTTNGTTSPTGVLDNDADVSRSHTRAVTRTSAHRSTMRNPCELSRRPRRARTLTSRRGRIGPRGDTSRPAPVKSVIVDLIGSAGAHLSPGNRFAHCAVCRGKSGTRVEHAFLAAQCRPNPGRTLDRRHGRHIAIDKNGQDSIPVTVTVSQMTCAAKSAADDWVGRGAPALVSVGVFKVVGPARRRRIHRKVQGWSIPTNCAPFRIGVGRDCVGRGGAHRRSEP